MKNMQLFVFVLALIGLTGCVATITPATNVADVQEVDFSQNFKTGKSCASAFLFFGPFGDASVVKAAKKAGISKVSVVEYEHQTFLYLYNTLCAVVHGE